MIRLLSMVVCNVIKLYNHHKKMSTNIVKMAKNVVCVENVYTSTKKGPQGPFFSLRISWYQCEVHPVAIKINTLCHPQGAPDAGVVL